MPNQTPRASAPDIKRDADLKKLLRLPGALVSDINEYRHTARLKYDRDAYERLLRAGLEAEHDRLRQQQPIAAEK